MLSVKDNATIQQTIMFRRPNYGKPQEEPVKTAKEISRVDGSQLALNAALVQKITYLERLPALIQRLAQAFHTFKVENNKIVASLNDQIVKLGGSKNPSAISDFEQVDASDVQTPMSPEHPQTDEIDTILSEVQNVNASVSDIVIQQDNVEHNAKSSLPPPTPNQDSELLGGNDQSQQQQQQQSQQQPEMIRPRSVLTRLDDGDKSRKGKANKGKGGKKGKSKSKKGMESSSSEEDI